MDAACEETPIVRSPTRGHGSYTIFCPGGSPETVDNYVLVSVDGTGFVVIKETIDLDGGV